MKKIILILLLVSASTLVSAQEKNKSIPQVVPYVGGSLGYANTSIDVDLTPTISKSLSDSSVLYNAQAGVLIDDLRIELSYQGRGLLKDSVHYPGGNIDFDMDTKLYFINFIAQGKSLNASEIYPYFGAGIGHARSKANVHVAGMSQEDSDSSAAIAAYAGLSFSANPNILIDIGADLYTFKAFDKTITNVSPHIGIRVLLTQAIL